MKKLVVNRKPISRLNDNNMSQLQGGTDITSILICGGWTWCPGCVSDKCIEETKFCATPNCGVGTVSVNSEYTCPDVSCYC